MMLYKKENELSEIFMNILYIIKVSQNMKFRIYNQVIKKLHKKENHLIFTYKTNVLFFFIRKRTVNIALYS